MPSDIFIGDERRGIEIVERMISDTGPDIAFELPGQITPEEGRGESVGKLVYNMGQGVADHKIPEVGECKKNTGVKTSPPPWCQRHELTKNETPK